MKLKKIKKVSWTNPYKIGDHPHKSFAILRGARVTGINICREKIFDRDILEQKRNYMPVNE